MCCHSTDVSAVFHQSEHVCQVCPKSTSPSQKESETCPCPWRPGDLAEDLKSPKLGDVMNAGGQSQGRVGPPAS